MPYNSLSDTWINSPEMDKLVAEKKSAVELQTRKHEDWNDNYELYRNKVKTNRLTQRQAVNIPLIKETVKTLLSKIDDAPHVDWKERGGDEMKQLIYQEVWNKHLKDNNLEIIDILEKKNVLLYGLSTKKLNISDDGVIQNVLDVFDTVFDPLMNAWDVDSARFIIQRNIFKSVREILADERYTQEGKDELKIWADAPEGLTQSAKNKEEWEKKMERLKAMGVENKDFPFFAGGDRIVNLCEHYTKTWNPKKKEFERRVCVYADDKIILMSETLEDLIGVDFWPFVVWSEDPETTDIYPDSVADTMRTPNKILNVWISQLVENRTLKNFQMHWFLPGQNYTPQTYTPGPGMMLPAPPGDDINKVIKPVEVNGLEDTLEAIQAITQIAERASGATAIEKGVPEPGQQTLGEVKMLVGNAMERATSMAKFYRRAWYDTAFKWDKLMHANAPKMIKLFKVSRDGRLYPKSVFKNDWKSESGYKPIVNSTSEQEANDIKTIQRWQFVLQQFPNNPALRQIAQKRELELLDLTPEELRQVTDAEKKAMELAEKQAEMQMQAQQMQMQQGQAQGQPVQGQPQPQMQQQAQPQEDLTPQMQELSQLIGA